MIIMGSQVDQLLFARKMHKKNRTPLARVLCGNFLYFSYNYKQVLHKY